MLAQPYPAARPQGIISGLGVPASRREHMAIDRKLQKKLLR